MLNLVTGRAGAGHSIYVFDKIKRQMNSSKADLVLLVPEQHTLETERRLIDYLGHSGIMQVEVTSFSRLAEKVLAGGAGRTRIVLDEQGKQMVLRKLIHDNAGALGVYRTAAGHSGFIAKISRLIAELKQQGITEEDLVCCCREFPPDSVLNAKLQDILLIYSAFNRFLADNYLDAEEITNYLVKQIEQNKALNDAYVWIDGLFDYSRQHWRLIKAMIPMAAELTITMVFDKSPLGRDWAMFEWSRKNLKKLQDIADELHEPINLIELPDKARTKPGDLNWLENELYAFPYRKYEKEPENIHFAAAGDLFEEMENIAAAIVSLVQDRGWRWRDIRVICPDTPKYSALLHRTLTRYAIPHFIDFKRSILGHPLVIFILAAINIIVRHYQPEDIFLYLKTGLTSLDSEQIDLLENYALSRGLRGTGWLQPITPLWPKEAVDAGEEEEIAEEFIRQQVIKPLEKLALTLRKARDYRSITAVLSDYLSDLQVEDKLKEWIENMRLNNQPELVYEHTQIWNITIGIFNQLSSFLGEQEVDLKLYRKVLEAGFQSYELGIIPATIDQVMVTNVLHCSHNPTPCLLVWGLNDGVFPGNAEAAELLLEQEKESMLQSGLEMRSASSYQLDREPFLLYLALSQSSHYLLLSYALADDEGRALRPALLAERLRQIFPALPVKYDLTAGDDYGITTPAGTLDYLIKHLRRYNDGQPLSKLWQDIYCWYSQAPEWEGMTKVLIRGLTHHNRVEPLGSDQASKLYRYPLTASVSRLEQYIACPFAHLVRYGLRPQERRLFIMEKLDWGQIYHQIIFELSLRISREGMDWEELRPEQCQNMLDNVIDRVLEQYRGNIVTSGPTYIHWARRVKRIAAKSVLTMLEHIQSGEFRPWRHELAFGRNKTLPPLQLTLTTGAEVYVEGRIDRVDLWEPTDDNAVYARIIDYKTGQRDLKYGDIYYGLNLQLIIYLQALLSAENLAGKRVLKPGGLFYYKIDDPMIESNSMSAVEIESQIKASLKLQGVLLDRVEIIKGMDKNLTGGRSMVVPAGLNQDGSIQKTSRVINEADLYQLSAYVRGLMVEILDKMSRGEAEIRPYRHGDAAACKYCRYKGICQFDPVIAGNGYRYLRKLSEKEVWDSIREGADN